MATLPLPAAATRRTSGFFFRMTLGLVLFILFGFMQFAARGMVDYGRAPLIFHVHGAVMTSWLGLLVLQAGLAGRGSLALHRRLGWASTGLLLAIVAIGSATSIHAVANGMVPPFFTPAYFLALVHVGLVGFVALVGAAIALRKESDWHRRLILGSTILIMEPALGRLLPMPLLGGWAEWTAMLFQLIPVAILAAHDRKTLGLFHPATKVVAGAVIGTHVLFELLAVSTPLQQIAQALAAG